MNVLEALAECVKRPNEVAVAHKGIQPWKWTGTKWLQWQTWNPKNKRWGSTGGSVATLGVYQIINGDGTPVEWEVVPVADIEATR